VALLYTQDEQGGMQMHCTATAFQKVDGGYLFSTASHCAVQPKGMGAAELTYSEGLEITNAAYFMSLDENSGTKTFLKATVVACGYEDKGDDFCIFYVKTDESFPIVALGEDSTDITGEDVVNISSPYGLGKQTFYGRITMPKLDRTVIIDEINWTHTVLLEIPGAGPGSSGSTIMCLNQHAVCAFLVGHLGSDAIVVGIPVSKFKTFLDNVEKCNDDYYMTDTDKADTTYSISKCKKK